MRSVVRFRAALVVAALAAVSLRAIADDGSVPPPPPVPSPQSPAPEPVAKTPPAATPAAAPVPTIRIVPRAAIQAPEPAEASPGQVVTLHLVAQQAPQPTAQTVTLRVMAEPAVAAPIAAVVAAPAPPGPEPVTAELRRAGPLRRAVGNFGERLATVGHDRVLIPRQRAQAQVLVQPAAAAVVVPAPTVQAVLASPQSPKKCRLFGH